jgi:hypothetical protein
MKTILIVFLYAIGTCGTQPPQDSAPDSRPGNDAKAVELFKKTLAGQTQGGAPATIKDLQADLEVTMHDTDPKTKERTRRSATVVQQYRDRGADKPLFRRQLIDKIGGNETIQGYDGERYWQKLGKTAARELRGRESKEDVDRIKDEMNRTRDYLRFLFLSNLEGRDVTLRYGGATKIKANGRERAVETVIRERPGEKPIDLYIGDADGRPVLFGFSRKLESGKTELITFAVHTPVTSGGATALVPLVAEYREEGMLTFEARAARGTDIRLNLSLADATFAMPQ